MPSCGLTPGSRSASWPAQPMHAAGGIVMKQPDDPIPAADPAVTPAPQAPESPSDRVPALAWVIGAVFVVVELAVSGRYGFQQDELYFIVAGHHLGFGYVDQPPLVPLLTRITDILGVSPMAIPGLPAPARGGRPGAAGPVAAPVW